MALLRVDEVVHQRYVLQPALQCDPRLGEKPELGLQVSSVFCYRAVLQDFLENGCRTCGHCHIQILRLALPAFAFPTGGNCGHGSGMNGFFDGDGRHPVLANLGRSLIGRNLDDIELSHIGPDGRF